MRIKNYSIILSLFILIGQSNVSVAGVKSKIILATGTSVAIKAANNPEFKNKLIDKFKKIKESPSISNFKEKSINFIKKRKEKDNN